MYRFVVALTFAYLYMSFMGTQLELLKSKTAVAPGQKVLIKISGGKEDPTFAGFLVQVRKENKAIGSFDVSNTEGMAKTITCHQAVDSAATHNSSDPKEQIEFNWIAPKTLKGKLNVYVTVAKDGATYWAHQKKERN